MNKKTFRRYRYRLFPGREHKTKLDLILDECRWVYNKTLEYREEKWKNEKKSVSKYDTHYLLPGWKKERSTLKIPYAQTFQDVQERVDLAFRAFFRRVKNGEKPGYPRFKSKLRYVSFTYPSMVDGNIRFVEDNKIRLPKIGVVRLKRHRLVEGTIKRVTLKKSPTGKWFICFTVETPNFIPLSKKKSVAGIDLGIKSFITFPDGTKIENPKFLRQEKSALAKAQRKFHKQEKGSKEREKARKIKARIEERIATRRDNFAHQLSRKFVNEFQFICIEELDIKSMQKKNNTPVKKLIKDVAWRKFIDLLLYKAEEAGREVIQIDPAYTSQTCSKCGSKKKLGIKERIYSCDVCDFKMDRDQNAAINILRLGLQSLGEEKSETLEALSLSLD